MRGRVAVFAVVVSVITVGVAWAPARSIASSERSPSMERDSIVAAAGMYAGMSPTLAVAVSHVEDWKGDSTARNTKSGALGLMQVMTFWADSFNIECGMGSLTGRWRNACVGTHIAVRYFQECGDWDCALFKYVGATCTTEDTVEHCRQKLRVGDEYVHNVMRQFGRTERIAARP